MDLSYNPSLLSRYGVDLSHADFLANSTKTVVVGMSGGVDSSVAALLIKLQGFRTIGLFMKNWDEGDAAAPCPADEDYRDVIKVCERIDIPYYSVNFVKEYREEVFEEFLADYQNGLTPNPDVLCNREIKFKVFYQKAKLLGADYLATGHYCQLEKSQAVPYLKKAVDQNKDQTYFLYAVEAQVFHDVLFPIGHLPKTKVRELAHEFQLATGSKKDSTGICFIGERNFKNFLSQYIPMTKGPFVDLTGKTLGQHDGSCFYTLGQRKGLGVGGPGEAWFVVSKKHAENQVVLAQGQDHPALYADELWASELNWPGAYRAGSFRCKAKVRYRQPDQDCTLTFHQDRVRVVFDVPQRAMTPRQSVVFYQGEICLGGGVIDEVSANYFELSKKLPEVFSVQV